MKRDGVQSGRIKSWVRSAGFLAVVGSAFGGGGPAGATERVAYVTGETPGGLPAIFRFTFDPAIPGSGVGEVAVIEETGLEVDGIDFVPGTGETEVVGPVPEGQRIGHYDIAAGALLPDFIPDTDKVPPAEPPAPGGTHPSSVLSTPAHYYYTENQFGFGGTPDHRIIRAPFGAGLAEVVFDGAEAPSPLVNFEGLEIVEGRLFFFAADRDTVEARALYSIPLTAGGLWNSLAEPEPRKHIGGLAEGPDPGEGPFASDGADELDFDPGLGVLFGTNIISGEVVAFDPFLMVEIVPGLPGSFTHFIDAEAVAAGAPDGLGLLGRAIDGIRADGEGFLVFSGRGGVLGSVDIGGVLGNGADNADVFALFDDPSFTFDDLTPLAVPRRSGTFRRGDADANSEFNGLVDALYVLDFQFSGGPTPPCMDAADFDDNGEFNGLVEALGILAFQFSGGVPPAEPGLACGLDPTEDELDCAAYRSCP